VQIDVERLRTRAQHLDRLRQTAITDEKEASLPSPKPTSFALHSNVRGAAASIASAGRRRLVEQRRVATSLPVSPDTIVWKFSNDSRRPCAISAW
jgi:hypothetical protein